MFKDNYSVKTNLKRLFMQQYERYLPTAFDESMTLLEKMNKLIESHNAIIDVVNTHVEFTSDQLERAFDIIDDNLAKQLKKFRDELEEQKTLYEELRDQMYGDLLPDTVKQKLEEWLLNGTIEELILDTVFPDWVERLQTVENGVAEVKKSYIDVDDYGLTGTNIEDSHEVLQFLVDSIKSGTLYLGEDKTYYLSSNLILPKNITLTGNNVTFKPLNSSGYENIGLIVVDSNTHISGITIDMVSQDGLAPNIQPVKILGDIQNVTFVNCHFLNASAGGGEGYDCFYLGKGFKNFKFYNCSFVNGGRNNMSVISGDGLLLKDCYFGGDFGLYNLDLEPNENDPYLKNIVIDGIIHDSTSSNAGFEKSLLIGAFNEVPIYNITIKNSDLKNSGVRLKKLNNFTLKDNVNVGVVNISDGVNVENAFITGNKNIGFFGNDRIVNSEISYNEIGIRYDIVLEKSSIKNNMFLYRDKYVIRIVSGVVVSNTFDTELLQITLTDEGLGKCSISNNNYDKVTSKEIRGISKHTTVLDDLLKAPSTVVTRKNNYYKIGSGLYKGLQSVRSVPDFTSEGGDIAFTNSAISEHLAFAFDGEGGWNKFGSVITEPEV